MSRAAGANSEHPRCATERVEAVTSLDILYSRFHEITMSHMQASDLAKSCGQKYSCPDGEPDCETRSVGSGHCLSRSSLYIESNLVVGAIVELKRKEISAVVLSTLICPVSL